MKNRRRKKRGNCAAGCLAAAAAIVVIAAAAVFLIPAVSHMIGGLMSEQDYGSIIRNGSEETEEGTGKIENTEDETKGFYYSQLTDDEKRIYREIYQCVLAMEESAVLSAGEEADVSKIYSYVMYDCPELFWCSGSSRLTIYNDHTEFTPEYTCTVTEKEMRQERIDAAAAECTGEIPDGSSDYDCVKYIYEYLVRTVDYDINAEDNQNIYSSLVGRRSVCAGYSRAVQYLLGLRDVECIYVLGESETGEAHAWNIVNCGGKYYQLDATYADPVFYESETGTEVPESMINYDYLCCSDEVMMLDHIQNTDVAYPACSSNDLDYYSINGMYYDSFDPAEILEKMEAGIYAGEEIFVCKFSDQNIYETALAEMTSDLMPKAAGTLAETYGISNVRYSYIKDDVHFKVTVIWNYQQ